MFKHMPNIRKLFLVNRFGKLLCKTSGHSLSCDFRFLFCRTWSDHLTQWRLLTWGKSSLISLTRSNDDKMLASRFCLLESHFVVAHEVNHVNFNSRSLTTDICSYFAFWFVSMAPADKTRVLDKWKWKVIRDIVDRMRWCMRVRLGSLL